MTREEKQKAINALIKSAPVRAVTQEEFSDYIQTLNKIIDWLEQEPGWIPCSERLPKENGEYIISLEDSVYPEASFFNGKWFMRSLNGIAREFGEYEVIAWMPRPEPYREDYYCGSRQKTGKWTKTKYGYTWTENNVCLNFVDYYDAKEDGEA